MSEECLRCELTDRLLSGYDSWEGVANCISALWVDGVDVVDRFFDPTPEHSWDGAHEQGHEGHVYMIFKYKGRHFRMSGTSDSYGGLHWSGTLKEVYPTKVLKTIYQYSEVKED